MDDNNEDLVALIARCAIKDESAFKKLYDRVGAYLNGVAIRIVRSPQISNEVLQEAMVQIWLNADQYRPHLAKPLTWLTSIVRYRALDRRDRENRIREREVDDQDVLAEITDDCDVEDDQWRREIGRHIRTCMQTLNPNSARSITLAYVHGFSREEIAQQLNSNASTVKSWLRRGAEKLKECLKKKLATIR